MSYAELEILREWANEILAMEKARVMTVEEMNDTIRLLQKGGVTDDRPQDHHQLATDGPAQLYQPGGDAHSQ
jgi:hypothetical protein